LTRGVTFIRRRGAAARPVGIAGAPAFRVALVALTSGLVTTTSIIGSDSSSLASSCSGAEMAFVDLVVARPTLTGLVVAAGADFLVTRDLDSIACARVVVGTAPSLVDFRFDDGATVVVVSASPARARVIRRGFAGEVGFRGAMADDLEGAGSGEIRVLMLVEDSFRRRVSVGVVGVSIGKKN
jgi:hypothetical protein